MANKVYNMAGGLHSASAYTAFENEALGGNAVASYDALRVSTTGGMKVTVAKGNALIRVDSELSRRVALTSPVDITITTADTTLPRKDLIVIYIDSSVAPTTDSQDNVNNMLKLVAVKGTPNVSPQAPDDNAVLQAIGAGNPFIKLAQVTVPAGATNLSNDLILDVRPHRSELYPASPYIAIRPSQPWDIRADGQQILIPELNKVTASSSNAYDYYTITNNATVRISKPGIYLVTLLLGTKESHDVLVILSVTPPTPSQPGDIIYLTTKSIRSTGYNVYGSTVPIAITSPGQEVRASIENRGINMTILPSWTTMRLVRLGDIYN
jgi:hypothetical protein